MDKWRIDVSNSIISPIRVLYAGRTTIDSKWSWPQLCAPYWRLYVNLGEGASIHLHQGDRISIPAGELVAIPAWMDWASSCDASTIHYVSHVQPVGLSRNMTMRLWERPLFLGPRLADDLVNAIDDWMRQSRGKSLGLGWSLLAVVANAFVKVYTQLSEHKQMELIQFEQNARTDPILTAIEERLHRPLKVKELADLIGVSPATLNRLFQDELQCSPASYIRERRIAIAAEELIFGDSSIDTVAKQVGFADRYALSKAFIASMGCGPASYRKAQRLSR